VHKLPFMTLPRWSVTQTQPISLKDALEYLTLAASIPMKHHEIVEIGGPDVISYRNLYSLYAQLEGRKPFIIRLPFLPEWLGGWWLNLFMPKNHAKIGQVMVQSMSNEMVVTHDRAKLLFPTVKPISIKQAIIDAR
jgi:uncharacterized protein YbjT (DUF2867 family)